MDRLTFINKSDMLQANKRANSDFLPPILVANFTAAAILSYNWSIDYLFAIALTVLAFAINVTFVKLNPTTRFLRTDKMDALRWIINIVIIDLAVSILLHATIAVLFCFWMTVIIGAFIDVYENSLRRPVVFFGFTSGLFSMWITNPDTSVTTYIAFSTTGLLTLAIINAIETHWTKECLLRLNSQTRESHLALQAESLFKSSLTGDNARIIAHEVDNMITAINFVIENPGPVELDKIHLSLNYVKQACDLILRESGELRQILTVKQLIQDLNLLIRKQVLSRGIDWLVECPPELLDQKFEERSGSCYFMIQNFVSNSMKAIGKSGNRGKIQLKFQLQDGGLAISIMDTGIGMTETVRNQTLSGKSDEVAYKNHGLGMKFVNIECERNNFKMFITPNPEGDKFSTAIGFHIRKIAS